jgi:hypothetical protein
VIKSSKAKVIKKGRKGEREDGGDSCKSALGAGPSREAGGRKGGPAKLVSARSVSGSAETKAQRGRPRKDPAVSKEGKKKKKKDASVKYPKTKTSSIFHKRPSSANSGENTDIENEILPKVPHKDNKSSQEKKSDLATEKHPKLKTDKSEKQGKASGKKRKGDGVERQKVANMSDEEEEERAPRKKRLDKTTLAKRKLSRMKKLGFLSAPPRR